MIFWVIAAGLTAIALLAILRPILSRGASRALAAADYDIEVYRSQLAEVERDAARGQLPPEEAEAARTEIGRRLLDADRRREAARTGTAPGGDEKGGGLPHRLAPYTVAALLPAAAFGLYLELGNPGAPDRPLALRGDEVRAAQAQAQARAGGDGGGGMEAEGQSLDQAAAALRQRLDRAPDDIEGWLMLARTEMARGSYDAAVAAFERVRTLLPADAPGGARGEAAGALAEALTLAAEGVVTPRARTLFEQAIARDPDDVRAEFYLAEADMQAGRIEAAMERWIALADAAPPDAPYLPAVIERARGAAAQLDRDIADRLPDPAAPSVSAGIEDSDALAARVEADPMDFEAWIGLIRARAEAGKDAAARAALAEARAVFAQAPVPRRALDRLAADLGLEPGADGDAAPRGPSQSDIQSDIEAVQAMSPEEQRAMIAGMVDGLAARLEDDPDDLQGWRMLGRSYRVLGRTEEALRALGRAQELAPEDIDLMILRARLMRERADGAPTAESLALMRRVKQARPDSVEANWFLALDALEAGDRQAAEAYFDTALEALPEGSERRAMLARDVARLLGD
ncbi:c-type cytochrome biogenesis protein CcmI [Marivibrio halodurans]|uniref:C-type cytochrome biogenesis protein CcmI n=1 Tax=Marivibrio halodurans TaxID=2039722 RepID=A0A8J7V1R3_9PROT|nr:c-type cytochrome biogenesis protein CcmI [Marivibrio halodurans]MBP5858061.1 c-type cytochrome biogenesis protein CcmI [Marivibrio halodurans]